MRHGMKAGGRYPRDDVRFAPESGHSLRRAEGPLSAKSGQRPHPGSYHYHRMWCHDCVAVLQPSEFFDFGRIA
jgi:hypothetical protein